MSEDTDMRYIVYGLDGDPGTPVYNACLNTTDMGPYIISLVGVGNPYWAFQSLPNDILSADTLGADFSGAPVGSDDEQTNRNNVAGLYASPPATGAGGKVWAA